MAKQNGTHSETEENFLNQFQSSHRHHIVDFMKIWYHYDTNKNGYLESSELKGFVRDLTQLKEDGKKLSDQDIDQQAATLLNLYDKNKDGKIELCELQKIIPTEENFLLQFQEDLTEKTFEKVFSHYDKDGNGVIEGPELIGLLRDLKEHANGDDKEYVPHTTVELEEYRNMILNMSDKDKDGKLQKDEIKLLFLG